MVGKGWEIPSKKIIVMNNELLSETIQQITCVCDQTGCVHFNLKNVSINCNANSSSIWLDVVKNGVTIFIALIAGLLALYQMKANIISSTRIRWIEDLRETLSKLYPVALNALNSYKNRNNELKMEKSEEAYRYYMEYIKNLSDFNALSNKIKMQLNSSEPDHKRIEEIIDILDSKLDLANIENATVQEIEAHLKLIVSHSKNIFKKEWEKSKRIFKI